MATWIRLLLATVVVLAVTWTVLVVLAARLPLELLWDAAAFLPQAARAARTLARGPWVPRRAKRAVVVVGL